MTPARILRAAIFLWAVVVLCGAFLFYALLFVSALIVRGLAR